MLFKDVINDIDKINERSKSQIDTENKTTNNQTDLKVSESTSNKTSSNEVNKKATIEEAHITEFKNRLSDDYLIYYKEGNLYIAYKKTLLGKFTLKSYNGDEIYMILFHPSKVSYKKTREISDLCLSIDHPRYKIDLHTIGVISVPNRRKTKSNLQIQKTKGGTINELYHLIPKSNKYRFIWVNNLLRLKKY
jgi:hypothetical protein